MEKGIIIGTSIDKSKSLGKKIFGGIKAFKSTHEYRCSHTCSGLHELSDKSRENLIKAFTSGSLRGRERDRKGQKEYLKK